MITVLTPTYNRCKYLKKAYESLANQTDKDFEWLIVDDGSTDDTKKLVDKFIKDNRIRISYYHKENGGKHTALNVGFLLAKGSLILILDSDDYLDKTAIKTIEKKWNYSKDKKIGGMSFIRCINGKRKKYFKKTPYISNHIDCRYNKGLLYDMCEVYKTSILRKNLFPIFEGEKYESESIVWNTIGLKYDTAYFNDNIYYTSYLPDGLTSKSRNLRIHNPKGAKANYRVMLNSRFKFKIRLRSAVLFNIFSCFDHTYFDAKHRVLLFITFIPSYIIYLIWKWDEQHEKRN